MDPLANGQSIPVEQLKPTIGIITALPKEYAAVEVAFEEIIQNRKPYTVPGLGAGRRYLLGEVPAAQGSGRHSSSKHSIVFLSLVGMGTNIAAVQSTILFEHFPNVKAVIMVGIAGGIPNPEKADDHVRLGDIVISDRGGVIQYDFIKEEHDKIKVRNPPLPPSARLLEAVRFLEKEEVRGNRPWVNHIEHIMKVLQTARPGEEADTLLSSKNRKKKVNHPEDPKRIKGQPRVFIGPVGSSNTLQKNPVKRDMLRDKYGVKAIEMEASGVADAAWTQERGYLIIRGICDYCDSNKNDLWQLYAAIVA
ncbi:MAG: 5'-methylthioadenosine/S-adenosylhomocysteine nucleosidase, partial [bacterium]